MLTLLHDPNNAASAAFKAQFGLAGQVIEGHDACVAYMPNIQGFPTVVYKGQPLFNPMDMEEVAAWQAQVDNPPTPPSSRIMTKYAFRTRVLTFAERMTMDNSTIPELVTMRNDLFAAEVVDLDEVAKYKPIMLATGLATEARIDEIIAGVTHA